MRERSLQRLYRLMDSPQGAILGGFCYGLWALIVNRHAGWPHAILIGATHWLMSAMLTYGCVALMRTLFRLPRDPRNGWLVSAGGSLFLTYTLLVGVHRAIGTPQILMTLLPGLLPTIGFAVTYSSLLLRETRASGRAPRQDRRTSAITPAGGRDARA